MPIQDAAGRTVYVAGFLLADVRYGATNSGATVPYVAVILKNRPAWQKGMLNGIGGKVEPFDRTFEDAMTRELQEEAGIVVAPSRWSHFATVRSLRSNVVFFTSHIGTVDYRELPRLRDDTDEPCGWYPELILQHPDTMIVPSCRFLIPLARQPEFTQTPVLFQWAEAPSAEAGKVN